MPTPAAPPSIRIAGMHRFPSGWSWSFGAHPLPWTGSLFGTVLDGTLRLTDERHVGRDQVLTTGMTYWLPLPHLLFRLENAGRHPLTSVVRNFVGPQIPRWANFRSIAEQVGLASSILRWLLV